MDIKYASEVAMALRQAGKMMTTNSFTEVKDKGNVANLVTDMDVKVQDFIIQALSTIIPNSSFLAEENDLHEETDGFMWVIDPIDGTTNYIYDFHHSAISVALVYEHEAILGVVYDPYLDEMFIAGKGSGAYLNDQPIRVSKNGLGNSLIMCGTTPYDKAYAQVTFDVMRRMFMAGKDIRRSGSAVLDLCYLACGRVDGFYEHRLAPWDFAAGLLIILEAGGRIMPLDGRIQFSSKVGFIAGNANNIEDMIEITGRTPEHIIVGTCHGTKPLHTNHEHPGNYIPKVEEKQVVTHEIKTEEPVETIEVSEPIIKEQPSMELLQKDNTVENDTTPQTSLDDMLAEMVQDQKDDE